MSGTAYVDFFIPGRPRTTQTGSVIRAGKRLIPTRRGTPWSATCGLVARQYAPAQPWDGPVRVSLLFVLPHPKGKRRPYVVTRPDLENMCKGLLDSWNGVLWRDDSQIVSLALEKVYEDDRLAVGLLVQATQCDEALWTPPASALGGGRR